MLNDKIVAAITAAINQYLAEEQGGATVAAQPPVCRAPVSNIWGFSGRDETMKLRNLWQLGIFKKQR